MPFRLLLRFHGDQQHDLAPHVIVDAPDEPFQQRLVTGDRKVGGDIDASRRRGGREIAREIFHALFAVAKLGWRVEGQTK